MTELTQAWGVTTSGCRRAVVIGAGSMGAGIAAQFANAGVPVDLLDIPAEGNRNARAEAGIAAQLKAGGFAGPGPAALVRPGNVEDDIARVAEADWIIEAVIENLEVKRALFAKIAPLLAPGAVVSSNTSTILRELLTEGFGAEFASRFAISHFFNPPRHMALLELVAEDGGPAQAFIRKAGRAVLGKTVIDCRDTPGFIANRIGCTWMSIAMVEALRLGLTIEEADAVQTAFGIPRTGVFGLSDLVGVDMIPSIWGSLMGELPAGDAINRFDLPANALVREMIAKGRFGRKSGAGFYRKAADGSREVIDPATGEYRAVQTVAVPGGGKDLAALLADQGKLGAYAREVLGEVLRYAAAHVAEISTGPAALDAALELGFAWRKGPFAIAQSLDAASRAALNLPAMPAVVKDAAAQDPLDRAKAAGAKLAGNASASLWDLGDGVGCLELTTKMNAVDDGVFDMIEETLGRMGGAVKALVVGNHDPRAFSAGANLARFVEMIESADWDAIGGFIARGHALYPLLRQAPVPSVAAVQGITLGGGCELTLHCSARVVHLEAKIGLPEHTLGILPGWGGCTRLTARLGAAKAFAALTQPRPAGSAREAVTLGFLDPTTTQVVMHTDDRIGAAMQTALAMIDGYEALAPERITTGGAEEAEAILAPRREMVAAGKLSAADLAVQAHIASVITGGPLGGELAEEDLRALEARAFVEMMQVPLTLARIKHILETGKPLRT
ncbi:3-hydroxyacyl-CoA dehydrogenase/enoyl-CoA hydratase family protein [Sinirhodobacter huangdaonensis]|uniref:3-hydroxyacyl-CoA dehydrogenase/enoyl-CoA hydratase family protein n=1 Tax=Paenirhodobacter huangdaonensis TaxID=2501515 RepID=A0A443M0L7_9RHOB|nr:3-hydroxyacyl-CoA dehydrogenase/enoyl-CoA hydratase family protein [Sinirhodobacter huangdaonensis]RWR54988.1 3-hydroxyacyl-CoA dehydrogenase/enoyl-CoA hydratase family protein [Sinirhodobacter huangdaonensis]